MRSFILLWLLIGLAILLFVPLPYYQKQDVYCESYLPQLCHKKGWYLGSSVWKQILPYLALQNTVKTSSNANPPVPASITNHPNKEPPLPTDLKEKYFPIWKEVFLKKNNMTEDYFSKHIAIENIYRQEWNEGESMHVRYLINISWSSDRLTDNILLKPKEGSYFTREQVKQNLLADKGAALYQNQVSKVIPLETILPYESLAKSLKDKCHRSLSPSETFIEQGFNRGYGELHLRAWGTVNNEKNMCKSATIRVEDGEILSCVDTPCRIN